MPAFTIQILEHNGTVVTELENLSALSWKFQIGAKGPGECNWSIAETDDAVLGVLDGSLTMPLKRDFMLLQDGFPLMGGFIDSVNMPLAGDELHFVGKDWSRWLYQDWRRYYTGKMTFDDPIDTVIGLDDAEEFHMTFLAGSTVQDWVEAILAPLSEDATEQVILTPLFSGTAFTQELVGEWSRASGLQAITLLRNLAAMGDPYGFDFWVDDNKELNLVGPRKTDELSVFPIATFTQSTTSFLGNNFDVCAIVDGDWTNNGPEGTDILFLDGTGNAMRYFRKQHQPSVDEYRRWGASTTIEGSRDPFTAGTDTEAEFKAAASSYRMMFPQRELTLTIKPEYFTFDQVLLDPVAVDYQKFPGSFRRINASFWVTSQHYRETERGSGDWVCDLTLDQIYAPI